MSLRILIVSQYFWPENFRINDLAFALMERGHEVMVLTGLPNYPSGKIVVGYGWWKRHYDDVRGIPVLRVPLFARRKSRSWQLVLNYLSFAIAASILGPWLLRGRSFDAIFVYQASPVTVGIPAMVLRKVKRAPILFWVQDLWPESLSATGAIRSKAILSSVSSMVKRIYKSCDLILLQSRGFVDPVVNVGGERKKLVYFPNWAESLYRPVSVPSGSLARSEVPSDGFIVMFAGNLGKAQSLETIVAAAELLKDSSVHWIFLGDGRQRRWLQQQVDARGLQKVHWLGSRPMETMPSYFALAGAMLVTLCADPILTTTIPGKVQSYLACARPLIGALDGEGAKVIEESGAGFAVASGDVQGLANAVLKMSAMTEQERQSMGDAAIAYYREHFEREQLLDQLEGWMDGLVRRWQ